MKKLLIVFALITSILLASFSMAFQIEYNGKTEEYTGSTITLVLNGNTFTPSEGQMPPIIIESRTLVPVREVFEALGGQVGWEDATKKVTITFGAKTIELVINSTTAVIDGESKELDVPAMIINNKTMVPVRFISENGGLKVDWDDATKTVSVSDPNQGAEIVTPEPATTPADPTPEANNLVVNAFNNKYTKYFGERRGKQAAYQVTNLIYGNNVGTSRFIYMAYVDGESTFDGNSRETILEIINKITSSTKSEFTITGDFDEEGYLTKVTLERLDWKTK